jgi:superoxide reductase
MQPEDFGVTRKHRMKAGTVVNNSGKRVIPMTFYRCKHCGQIVAIVKETKVPIKCCGEDMEEIIPGTTDAAVEKHVPVLSVSDGKAVVTVGSVAHPMLPEHYIEWIAIVTKNGNQRVILKPDQEPKAEFALLPGDEVLEVYAYCNLHSLWKA